MDNTPKFLKLLTKTERLRVAEVIGLILANDTKAIDIKKMSGYQNLYRARIGTIRIIYMVHTNYNELVFVGRRNEKIYKKF
ncbi:MAG: mRNA-degrading endonuclease RelE of RelBE toxin-antitoxin system [Acidimicrobiales bacterium]|jgi:mRNA-degrading endonuclease RelE of RelBE toxin-antitoxin system